MNNVDFEKMIEKFKKYTKEKKITWNRIKTSVDIYSDENSMLKAYLEQYDLFSYERKKGKYVDLINSYVTDIESGKVYLFSTEENDSKIYYLCIQSSIQSNIISLNEKKEFQSELKELEYLISENLNGVDNYLEKLMKL